MSKGEARRAITRAGRTSVPVSPRWDFEPEGPRFSDRFDTGEARIGGAPLHDYADEFNWPPSP
jgi:hypothetical protein